MLRNEYKEFEYKEVEDVIKRICVECGEEHDINQMSLYSDGFRCESCSILKDFDDSLTDEDLQAYYKWLAEEEKKEEAWEERYSKMDVNELERRDFIRKYPTTDCDGCGEVHNTEDMHIGIDATGEVVLVLCKKCAGK